MLESLECQTPARAPCCQSSLQPSPRWQTTRSPPLCQIWACVRWITARRSLQTFQVSFCIMLINCICPQHVASSDSQADSKTCCLQLCLHFFRTIIFSRAFWCIILQVFGMILFFWSKHVDHLECIGMRAAEYAAHQKQQCIATCYVGT